MLRVFVPFYSSKKLALSFFRIEQQKNSSLHGLSAAQKKKIILRMFKELSKKDMEALKVKAAAWEAKKFGVNTGDNLYKKRKEVTPYELFFKEQLSNPSIASIASPAVREKKLFAIYNSLPDATKEALEQRARRLSEGGAVKKVTTSPNKRPLAGKKREAKKKSRLCGSRAEKSKGKKKKKEEEVIRKKTTKKFVVSPFCAFVKEQMSSVKQFPSKERMKIIAQKWRSLKAESSEAEAAAEAAAGAGVAAVDPSVSPITSVSVK